jgi:hypothetical protein
MKSSNRNRKDACMTLGRPLVSVFPSARSCSGKPENASEFDPE